MSGAGSADRLEQAKAREAARLSAAALLSSEIAHELNNMITVVLGNGELLADALAEDPARQSLAELIVLAAERAAALSANLLNFARRQQPRPQAVAINDWLLELLPVLQAQVGDDIDVHTDLDPDAWPVRVDPAPLESVLLALCTNARAAFAGRYARQSRTITIGTRNAVDAAVSAPGVEPGGHVQIMVADTGRGMDRETRIRATDMFFCGLEAAPRNASVEGEGEGLGLSLVHSFIKQSQGFMAIDSTPAFGTSVRLWLPRAVTTVNRR